VERSVWAPVQPGWEQQAEEFGTEVSEQIAAAVEEQTAVVAEEQTAAAVAGEQTAAAVAEEQTDAAAEEQTAAAGEQIVAVAVEEQVVGPTAVAPGRTAELAVEVQQKTGLESFAEEQKSAAVAALGQIAVAVEVQIAVAVEVQIAVAVEVQIVAVEVQGEQEEGRSDHPGHHLWRILQEQSVQQ